MESETLAAHYQPNKLQRLLSTIVPVLLIAVGYVDPGKWVVFVEGGARFGVDLMIVLLLFNLGAILCQYLSARIAVVTGRDLAQICSEEYDKVTCIFLGVQAEISVIALDLTMVLGTAHGLNAVFGFDLLSCIFLTATNAVLLPIISSLVDNGSARFLSICWASFILLSYVFGMLISQPENPLSMDGMLTKLNGDSAFALMSLLGASIMPHNFYLHSSIVQRDQGSKKLSKEALCNEHFFAIVCIFSGIFLVNYVLVNSAASVFYNSTSGLTLLTFQEALSLLDQVFRSSLVTFVVVLVMFFSNQITALTWDLGKQAVVHDLFGMDLPGWLHHVTVRIIAIVAALYCVWTSGAEGLYQMLICTQVGVALVLPSAVIPLFRVASSRSIMGIHKISPLSELLSLGTFFGMLGLKIIFVTEMIFGDSEWVSNLKWDIGSSVSVPYVVLLVAAFSSLGLMLWLAATPMKSASSTFDPQALYCDIRTPVPESTPFGDKVGVNESRFNLEWSTNRQEPTLQLGKLLGSHSNLSTPYPEPNLPETLQDFETFPHLTTIDENKSEITFANKSKCDPELSISAGDAVPRSTVYDDVSVADSAEDSSLTSNKLVDVVEKTLHIEGDIQNDKDDEGDSWVPEEVTKEVSANSQPPSFEGPGSYKSISGKNDDIGNGTGSLSRLGLGRAARRHLTVVLDEFWGQLFDSHGQATQEAKSKKLDILLGVESKMDPKPPSGSLKLESIRKESNAYLSSMSASGSDLLINSNMYSHKQQMGNFGDKSAPAYGAQKDSYSLQSAHLQLLDAYVRSLSHDTLESGERRYSSMHIPTPSSGYDQQPATIHGYELAYLNRIANERRNGYSNGKVESPIPKSKNLVTSNSLEFYPSAYGQKPQSSLSSRAPPGFGNVPMSRNTSLQSGNNLNDLNPSGNAENIGSTASAKKFHSSPDIKKLYVPNRESLLLERTAQRDSSMGYGQSSGRSPYERTYVSASPRVGGPPGFDQPSPSKVYRDAIPLQYSSNSATASLWTRQPFEQFGGTAKNGNIHADRFGAMQSSFTREAGLMLELEATEARLLQSFRSCIVKLLKLEGSEWLFRLDDGADEDLVYGVAARERFLYEAEMREINAMGGNIGESSPNRKPGSASKSEEVDCTKFLMMSIPHCGEGCIWKLDLIVSFGIWCIHRILELSHTESRPELWGKYTYVLNRLQGIIDLAFFKPRSPMAPCLCLAFPVGQQQRSNMSAPNGSLAMPAKQGWGRCTMAPMLVEKIKDIETAISSRKGRAGTAAGDVAFPKGKENLASVLKRYKRRLSNKAVGLQELRNLPPSTPY